MEKKNFDKESFADSLFESIQTIFECIEKRLIAENKISQRVIECPVLYHVKTFLTEKREWVKKCQISDDSGINKIECTFNEATNRSADYELPSYEAAIILNGEKIFYAKKFYSGFLEKESLKVEMNDKVKYAYQWVARTLLEAIQYS